MFLQLSNFHVTFKRTKCLVVYTMFMRFLKAACRRLRSFLFVCLFVCCRDTEYKSESQIILVQESLVSVINTNKLICSRVRL